MARPRWLHGPWGVSLIARQTMPRGIEVSATLGTIERRRQQRWRRRLTWMPFQSATPAIGPVAPQHHTPHPLFFPPPRRLLPLHSPDGDCNASDSGGRGSIGGEDGEVERELVGTTIVVAEGPGTAASPSVASGEGGNPKRRQAPRPAPTSRLSKGGHNLQLRRAHSPSARRCLGSTNQRSSSLMSPCAA